MIGVSVDYSKFARSLTPKVMAALALINNPEVAPEVRQLNQEILFREVGSAVYAKIYDMNAYDFEIEHTKGTGIDDRYFGMAKMAAAAVSVGGAAALNQRVENFVKQTIAKAQFDATTNAKQSGKRPTVTRKMNSETCDWCESLAGTYTNPDSEVFKRHRKCDCIIETSGYRSRNGLLDNYVKPQDRS